MKLSNRVFVSTPFENNKNLPLDFPWLTFRGKKGAMLTLQGDISSVHNLQQELGAVKQIVNRDINKWGLKIRDIDIQIEFVEEK